jgi:hypothetical protein
LSTHARLGLPSGLFPSGFPTVPYMHSSSPHSCYMPCPSHPPLLDNSSYIWRKVRVVELLIMQFSPTSKFCWMLEWLMMGKESGRKWSRLIEVTFQHLPGETKKIVTRADGTAEIRTEHLMNTSVERYRRANPLGDEPYGCWSTESSVTGLARMQLLAVVCVSNRCHRTTVHRSCNKKVSKQFKEREKERERQGSSIGIATGYRLDDRRTGVRVPIVACACFITIFIVYFLVISRQISLVSNV